MAVPAITSVTPAVGSGGGLTLVEVIGTDFASDVTVQFGGALAEVNKVRTEGGVSIADVLTPAGSPLLTTGVDVTITNLDGPGGAPVAGETDTATSAYTFLRFNLTHRPPLVRVVEALLTGLRQAVLENTGISTSVDWDYKAEGLDDPADPLTFIDTSKLPNVTISGPDIEENKFLRENVIEEVIVSGPHGDEVQLKRSPFVADLLFDLIAASASIMQSLSLLNGLVQHYHKNTTIFIDRDADDSSAGQVEFDVDFIGLGRSRLRGGADDVRVYTWEIRVRGFPVTEDELAFDFTRPVGDIGISTQPI